MVAPQLPMTAKEAFDSVTEFALATIHIVDYDGPDATRPAGMVRLSTPDTEELTAELDGATEWLGVPADEILLAALARTIAKTLGDGIVPVDVASERGSLLDAVPLRVRDGAAGRAPTEMLRGVHRVLASAAESAADGDVGDVLQLPRRGARRVGTGAGSGDAARAGTRAGAAGVPHRGSGARSTGGTTPAVSSPTPSKSSPSSSRSRSSR